MRNLYFMAAMALGSAMDSINNSNGGLSDRDISKMRLKRHQPAKQGQKEWYINGKTVYAATKKAAIKKANKIK